MFSNLLLQTKRWWEAVSSHSRRFCICHIAEGLEEVEAGRSYFKGEKVLKFFFLRYIGGLKKKLLAHPHAAGKRILPSSCLRIPACIAPFLSVTLHLSNGLLTSLIFEREELNIIK